MRLRKKTRLGTVLKSFERALETDKHIYYVNFDGDVYASVIMLDRKMNEIDKGFAAYVSLIEDVAKGYSWMSKKLQENLAMSK